MDNYTKYARVIPSIAAMLIPLLLTAMYLINLEADTISLWGNIQNYILKFIPAALIYSALGYFGREIFRSTSKILFQFCLFKENETEMPTTKFLLWSTNEFSVEKKRAIAKKVKERFDIKLLSKPKEASNIHEAKLTIVDAVGAIRNVTREDPILLQYNQEFGFCRNYLGGSVYAFALILLSLIANLFLNFIPGYYIWIAAIVQLVFDVILFISLKYRGKAYARQLYNSFVTLP